MSESDWRRNDGVRYAPETDTYHALYQPDEPGQLAGAVIYLVSAAVGKDPETMDPLYETVDTDALEGLFRSREGQTGHVKFRYCGCEVTAMSNGEVVVTPENDE